MLRDQTARCLASPSTDAAPIYNTPYGFYPVIMDVVQRAAPGENRVVTGREANGWYQLDSLERWIWLDDGWNMSGSCDDLPVVDVERFEPMADPNLCYYAQIGIASPFNAYTDPRLGAPDVILELDYKLYQAVSRTERWYEIVLDDGQAGWVRWGTGSLVGNCQEIPFYRMRPVPPEGICTVYLDATDEQDYLLYDFPNQPRETVAPMPESEYVQVEARDGPDGALRVRLADGTTGWLGLVSQQLFYMRALSGPCDELPLEPDTRPGG